MAMQPAYAPPPPQKQGFPVWAIVLIAIGGVAVIVVGIAVALALYGTRRYIASAKTAEAKNVIGAVSRGAVAAYERETMVGGSVKHELCSSATPVPSSILMVRGKKYQPNTSPGSDFDAGSTSQGWRCLKFMMTHPMYYQYHYNKGGGYIAGAGAPGANGFEAAAQGDIDADGVKSTFARTGQVTPSGDLRLATTIYIDNEFE